MQSRNIRNRVAACFVAVAMILAFYSIAALAQPDQNKLYNDPTWGWILYYTDGDTDGWHDPGEAFFAGPGGTDWNNDNSCWMASASNLLVFDGHANPYNPGWLGAGGAVSPNVSPWGAPLAAGGGGAFMTFDDGGWQHWAISLAGLPFQGPIITVPEFGGAWAVNPITWSKARLAENHAVGITVWWGDAGMLLGTAPGRVDLAKNFGYHAITLYEIDDIAGTVTLTDSDDGVAGTRVCNYTFAAPTGPWIILNLYTGINVTVNYAVALGIAGVQNHIWPMFRHDLKNTGRSPYVGPHCSCIRCICYMQNNAGVRSSPAIAEDGTIYVGNENGELVAIQPDCRRKWTYNIGGVIRSSPAIDSEGTIYVGSMNESGPCTGAMYAINPNGTLKWRYPVTGWIDNVESSPAVVEEADVLYFGTACDNVWAGAMYALYLNGTLKCVYNNVASGWVTASPGVKEDGNVVFGDYTNPRGAINIMLPDPDCTIYCRNPIPDPDGLGEIDIFSSPAIDILEDQIYFGGSSTCTNLRLWACDNNCDTVWSYKTGGVVPGSPALASDGTVYIGSYDNNLYAINPNGTLQWSYLTNGDIFSSPAVDGNGTIYVGNTSGTFYAINSNGTLKWSRTTGNQFLSSPAIGNRCLVVGDMSGRVIVFGSHRPWWPTAVELASFTAAGYDGRVEIEWTTASEIDNAGFNVHRSTNEEGEYVQINEGIIQARGSEVQEASYSFTDRDVEEGVTYYYWLENIDLQGDCNMHGPVSVAAGSGGKSETPAVFSLAQNHPNPFNPNTEIGYVLPVNCRVRLEVFNVLGQRIVTLVDEYQNAGNKVAQWNGKDEKGLDVSSGVYFYRLRAGSFTEIKKMALLR